MLGGEVSWGREGVGVWRGFGGDLGWWVGWWRGTHEIDHFDFGEELDDDD